MPHCDCLAVLVSKDKDIFPMEKGESLCIAFRCTVGIYPVELFCSIEGYSFTIN